MKTHCGLQLESSFLGVWSLLSRELVSEMLTPFCKNNQGEERSVQTPFVPHLLLKAKDRDISQAWAFHANKSDGGSGGDDDAEHSFL